MKKMIKMKKKFWLGISFAGSSSIGLLIGLFFYIPSDPSFRPWANYFCDVASGPWGGIISVGIGIGLTAISLGLLHIQISKDLRKTNKQKVLTSIYLITGILSSITLLILAIFPLNPTMPLAYQVHFITSTFYWTFYGIAFVCLGILEFSDRKFPSLIAILGGFFALFFAVGFPLQELGIIAKNIFVYLSMWGAFLVIVLWMLINVIKYWNK